MLVLEQVGVVELQVRLVVVEVGQRGVRVLALAAVGRWNEREFQVKIGHRCLHQTLDICEKAFVASIRLGRIRGYEYEN